MEQTRLLHLVAAAAVVVSLTSSTGARAEGPPQQAIMAQVLYDRAMSELEEEQYDEACPRFDEVARLLPDSLAARTTAAECHLRAGRLATALARYASIEADAAAGGTQMWLFQARARAEALRPRVAELVLMVSEQVKALPGLEVRCNGALVGPSEMGVPLPRDPGTYKIVVTAPGRAPLVRVVSLDAEGQTVKLEVGMPAEWRSSRGPIGPPPMLAPHAPKGNSPPQAPALPPSAPPTARPGSLLPGVVVLGAGVAALGIGAVTGGVAIAAASDLKSTCRSTLSGLVCPPSQQAQEQHGEAVATVSTAELVAGAAVATVGVVLLVVRPFGREVLAAVTAQPRSLGLVGRF
jgi:hypothetical protein